MMMVKRPTRREPPKISVRELRDALAPYPDDWELTFGGLEFYRVKTRGENLVQIEFSQLVFLDKRGRLCIQGDPRGRDVGTVHHFPHRGG